MKPQIFDLIYFDGNHSEKATLEYFELLLKDIEQENVDLIIRDTVDVYGAEIAKILNVHRNTLNKYMKENSI